jgi:hypothetical protein
MPRAWRRWAFHQRSDSGTVAGITGPVDVNDFNGGRRSLQRLTVRDRRQSRRKYLAWERLRALERRSASR